jgi:hypothetical protein
MKCSTEQTDGIAAGIDRPAIPMEWGCDTLEVLSVLMGEFIYVSSSK